MSRKIDELKGRGRETLDDLKDDDEMRREGKRDQAAGSVKQEIDDVRDWAEDKVDDVKDRIDRH